MAKKKTENDAPSGSQQAPPAKRRKTQACAAAAVATTENCLADKTNLSRDVVDAGKVDNPGRTQKPGNRDDGGDGSGDHSNSSNSSFQLKLRKRSLVLDASIALDGQDHINQLPDEVVLRVFKLLPRKILIKCSLVSRRFRRLVMDDVFWRSVDLGLRLVPPGTVGQLLDRGVVTLRLARSNLSSPLLAIPETGFSFTGRKAPKLTTLDLSMASVSPAEVERLLTHAAPSLKRLSLEQCELTGGCLERLANPTKVARTATAASLLLTPSPSPPSMSSALHTLNLAMCTGIGDGRGLRAMLRGCRNLRDLNLSWTGLSQGAVDRLAGVLPPELSKLNLSGCRDTLTDAHVGDLCVACPLLLELVVSDAVLLTDVTVAHVCAALRRLRSFSASRCYKILPVSYLAFVHHPRLENLQVFGCLREDALAELKERIGPRIAVNEFMFSAVARPTVGTKRTSLWGIPVREMVRP